MSAPSHSFPDTHDRLSAEVFAEIGQATTTGSIVTARIAAVLAKMTDEWRAGKGRPAEDWLAEYPELTASPEQAVRIIYEEYCLRDERAEKLDPEEFYRRFPQWRDELAVAIECHSLLRFDGEPGRFPNAGETLGELRLQRELGRGAIGRVFLATQPSLSDRTLAVKLTPRRGNEHLSLARLQHTNIVPLFLVQDFPDENLRAICMPYLGGTSWGAILKAMHETSPAERTGKQVVERLLEEGKSQPATGMTGPALAFLNQSSYVDAVCWIGACLADALYYAHQRGLVHLDLKPSNVLLSADGQPMLLDFHIACPIESLKDQTIERLGGTPGYMSPEQRAAAEAIRCGAPITQTLDGRSDVYSLGVVLYESLSGQSPPSSPAKLPWKLERANPRVSRGLADILCKSLAADPAERYADAAQLATDLRCHLANLPLRSVGNRSVVERLTKWRRRKPYAIALGAVAVAAALVVSIVAGLLYRDRVRGAEMLFAQSQRELANNQFEAAIADARSGNSSLRFFPWQVDLRTRLQRQGELAVRLQANASLHQVVEDLRFLDGQQPGDGKLAALASSLWQMRQKFLSPVMLPDGSVQKPDEQLTRDLTDLAILSTALDVQLAPEARKAEANAAAIRRLQEAEEISRANPWLELEIRRYRQPGEPIAMDSLPKPRSIWDYYALGRWLARGGRAAEARDAFQAAVDLAPNEFWPQYQLMRCLFDNKQFEPALVAASVCVALEPQRGECFYNRGLSQEALSHRPEARRDFERASDIYYRLACVRVDERDLVGARQWLAKSLAANPENAAARALDKDLAAKVR